ncbi:uncharacterized protein BO80DRAFT_137232 [Aspergillus ibericus CBS 121593]|uniref:Uncharacterized protein n=1 Tax=Aspergillus ibericus CBS 121593 TaxID=1448316 RepID=A0A395HD83_9EURO|nr:hypothetical protein BO80DRAFT_137232 [Aspergillus ibericus CBS 121593]RAL05459.1 hypothetical protein BO80DRAFT_137232 [Aspergillus ibericus CBS 121593]
MSSSFFANGSMGRTLGGWMGYMPVSTERNQCSSSTVEGGWRVASPHLLLCLMQVGVLE